MLPCPWSGAVIEISLCSSPPPPQQLPCACLLFYFFNFFFPSPSSSSFSKCCLLSTWAEEEVKAGKTNAGCQIAGLGWEGEGSESSCPAGSRRRCCMAHSSPRHARATGVSDACFCSTAAEKKSLYFGGENKLCHSFGALQRRQRGRQNVFATISPSPTSGSAVMGYIPV